METIAIISLIVFCITVFSIILSLLNNWKLGKCSVYWIVALSGAMVLLLLNLDYVQAILGALIQNVALNPIKILIFFISMTIMSLILDKLGFFKFLANKCVKLAKNSQLKLFLIFYIIVSILTIFTSNDIVILSFVPFICYFCKNSEINPAPYVFSTFVAANTWSMLFVIGNPTNVYLSTYAGLDFFSYLKVMALPTIVTGILSFLVLYLLFRKELSKPIENVHTEEIGINKPLIVLNVIMLLSCIVTLAISAYINLEMWYLALGFVIVQIIINLAYSLITKKSLKYIGEALKKAPWEFVPFLISMFVIIKCLEANGVIQIIADLFMLGDSVFTLGISAFLFSNIVNNIPMTTLFASILSKGSFGLDGVYASVIGSNLGAILTPVGALAGIMFLNILREKDVDFTIKSFVKYGVIVSVVSLFGALVTLYLI